MDDVSDAISDMKGALGDVVEDWQEELMEEQEELAKPPLKTASWTLTRASPLADPPRQRAWSR